MTAEFENPGFRPSVGLQFVPLTLTLGWRSVESAGVLYVLTPIDYVQHEFTEEGVILRPLDFLANPEAALGVPFDVRFTEEPLPLEDYPVGDFTLHLSLNGAPFEATLSIVDTTPPTATSVDGTTRIGEDVNPEDFVTDVFDASPINSIIFVEYPNIYARDNQVVQIAIEDIFGNRSFFSAELTILLNQEPPVIEGVPDIIESEVGTEIDYLNGITAFDDFGRELEVVVYNQDVDTDTEGTYTVIYRAEDLTGLSTEIVVTVHVLSVSPEYIYERVDATLARILNDRMTQTEKVRAIYTYMIRNLTSATVDREQPQSLLAEAYRAVENRRGDSYVYSAYASVLLERAGIPNMLIDRIDTAEKSHRWNLVNPDGSGWRHFDAFPTGLVLGIQASGFTDAQAKDFARRIEAHNKTKDYFTYNPELYPEIVQE